MKISQVIRELEAAQAVCGDVPVIFATDSEVNSYFNMDGAHRCDYTDAVIFYPVTESEDITELITNLGEE